MVDPIGIGLIVAGLVLLLFGAALSVYGVALLGFIVGAGGGYLLGPSLGGLVAVDGLLASAVAILVLGIIGAVAAYMMLSVTVAGLSFVSGVFLGFLVLAELLVDGPWYIELLVSFGIGIGAALFSLVFTKTALVLVTAFSGAAFSTQQLTQSTFLEAQDALVDGFDIEAAVDALVFDLSSPLFLAAFVLGVLSQFGLFKLGYVAKIATILPGASIIRDRGEEDAEAT